MSVIKRGEVWYIRYDLPRGSDGRRKQKMLACPGLNKRQAEQKLRDTLSALHNGTYADPSVVTIAQYLDGWLSQQESRLSPLTIEAYGRLIRKHIIPSLGDTRLDRLSPAAVQAFYRSLRLAPQTVAMVHAVLHSALKAACRLQMIARNPADYAELPASHSKEVTTASVEEIAELRESLRGTEIELPVLMILATGMRRGEALGLRWEDYNAETRTVVIRRSVCRLVGRTVVKPPKSGRVRVVLLPRFVCDELPVRCSGYMFPDRHGEPQNPDAFSKAFKRVRGKLSVTLHGLRHTQATLLILAGVPARVVSERLGHSTTSITQDIYAHVLPHAQAQAADIIEETFGSDVCKTCATETANAKSEREIA